MQTVADIMQRDVITVSHDTSIRELVDVLTESDVSGAPVIDRDRKVIGVVSQTDVVAFASSRNAFPEAGRGEGPRRPPSEGEDEDEWPEAFFVAPEEWGVVPAPVAESIGGSALDDVTVEEIMTPLVYSVPPAMPIPELARFLVDGRIHRALVVEDETLVGIVTAFDVLGLVANGGSA